MTLDDAVARASEAARPQREFLAAAIQKVEARRGRKPNTSSFDPTKPVMCRDGTPAIVTEIGPNYVKARGMCINPEHSMTFRRDTGRCNLHAAQDMHIDLVNAPAPRQDHRVMMGVPEVPIDCGPHSRAALIGHLKPLSAWEPDALIAARTAAKRQATEGER